MERVGNCVGSTRSTRGGCRICAAILMTSLLAGIYVYVVLLRMHGRRRTVLRPASRDPADVTDDAALTVIGGYRQSRGPEVDTRGRVMTTTTLEGNRQCIVRLTTFFLADLRYRERRCLCIVVYTQITLTVHTGCGKVSK